MNLIKVGDSYLNLDRVNEVRRRGGNVDVYFDGVTAHADTLEYNVTSYADAEAEALLAWLDNVSIDVVAQKACDDRAAASLAAWQKLAALAFAHGTSYSDQVQPSFPGARRNAALALSATDSVRAEFIVHCAQCDLSEPDDETFSEWQSSFVSGVLSR